MAIKVIAQQRVLNLLFEGGLGLALEFLSHNQE